MSWKDWILPAVSVGAAPFTGGASLTGLLGSIGKVAGNAAQGAATQRTNQNELTQRQNSLLAQLFGINQNAQTNALEGQSRERLGQGNLDLEQRKFSLAAPSARASQAVRGSLIQNLQPVSFSGLPSRISSSIPTITGGLTPAAISPEARQAGGLLTRQAIMDMLKGDSFAPQTPTDFQGGVLHSPQMAALQDPGKLESILGAIGLIGGIGGAVGDTFQQRRKSYEPSDQYGYG